ncbi:MAG: sigma 54-interacting transcriptional regulator [Sandaracinaceae bacterium]
MRSAHVIGGRYELLSELGRGSVARAWRARDLASGDTVALKLLHADAAPNALTSEFRWLLGRWHPNVVHVRDFGWSASEDSSHARSGLRPYYTSDLVEEGRPLRADDPDAPVLDALRALAWLHRLGVVHGDVKADNLLVRSDGRGVLIDLSCATRLGRRPSPLRGTPSHLAPELRQGGAATPATDLYAMGVMLSRLGGRHARLGATLTLPREERPARADDVLDWLGAERGGQLEVSARAARMWGRDASMRALEGARSALVAGDEAARVLQLTGPSGIGVSRVLERFRQATQLSGVRVFELHPRERFASLIQRAFGIGSGDDVRGLSLLEETLRRAAEGPPSVLLVDDVEARSDRARLLALARAVPERGRLLVVLGRPGEAIGAPVPLPPLRVDDIKGWADEVGVDDVAPRVHAWSGGVPGQVERGLGALRAGRTLPPPSSRSPLSLPPLSAAARHVLAVLSLASPHPHAAFDSDALAELTAGRWVRLEGALATLERTAEGPLILAALPRPAILNALDVLPPRADILLRAGEVDRALGRLSAGEPDEVRRTLERLPDTIPETHHAVVARALLDHGAPARVRDLLDAPTAGSPEALLRAEADLKLGHPGRVLTRLAEDDRMHAIDLRSRALLALGRYSEARAMADVIASNEPALDTRLSETRGLASSYLGEHDVAALALSAALSAHRRAGNTAGRLRVTAYQAIAAFRQGRFSDAAARYRDILDLARREGLDDQLAPGWLNLGTALQESNDFGGAIDAYERALRAARWWGEGSTETLARYNLANLFAEVGRFADAERLVERCAAAVVRHGLHHLDAPLERLRGELALARGERDQAATHLRAAASMFDTQGATRDTAECDLLLLDCVSEDERSPLFHTLARQVEGALDLSLRLDVARAARQMPSAPQEARATLEGVVERASEAGLSRIAADAHAALSRAAERRGLETLGAHHRAEAARIWERMASTLSDAHAVSFLAHPARAVPRPGPVTSTSRSAERSLQTFLAVNRRLTAALDVDAVLEAAVDAAIELTGAERGFVVLGADNMALRVVAARSLDRAAVPASHLAFSTSIAARVIEEDTSLVTTDALSDPRFEGEASVHSLRLSSVACVPIRRGAAAIGALYLDNRFERGRFHAQDVTLLEAFADQVAIALSNAELHRQLRERTSELERAQAALERTVEGQATQIETLHREVEARQQALEYRYDYTQIIGRSPAMRRVLGTLERVIDSPLTVLIGGESGTGKELVARAIHYNGPRREHPMVSLNCGALPETLLESELFGHVRGAFTGADRDRTGLLASAEGGTVFLDELGEMPLSVQVKLLRALQERTVLPVGADRAVPIDIRLVCATNRDLAEEVSAGRFRADLFYRVSVVGITLPPLRERAGDITALATHFVAAHGDKRLTARAHRALADYPWPGNVRELENVVARACLMADGSLVDVVDLALPAIAAVLPHDRNEYEQDEKTRVLRALTAHRWNVSRAARELGMVRQTLYRKLERYRIERPNKGA